MGKQSALPKDLDKNQPHKENESITMGFWIFPTSDEQQRQIPSSEMSKLQVDNPAWMSDLNRTVFILFSLLLPP